MYNQIKFVYLQSKTKTYIMKTSTPQTNIRIVNGKKQVNSIGFFKSDFFNMEDLIERQNEIHSHISNLSEGKNKTEMETLYNVTEYMRVELLK